MFFFEIYLKIRAFFVKKPQRELTWSLEDYKLGKKWAKSQKHPFHKYKTLWDFCKDEYDSVYTIHNINTFLKV